MDLKFYCTIFSLASLLMPCCRIKEKSEERPVTTEQVKQIAKPGSSFTDTLNVKDSAAVFYQPDSLQEEKIKMVTKKSIFDGSSHEYIYQQRNAHAFLKKFWPRLVVVDTNRFRFIRFIKKDKSIELVDLDKLDDSYGLLVFDTRKSALLLDMTNIETQVPRYFSKNEKQ